MENLGKLFRVLKPPASASERSSLAAACGGRLPEAYLEFLAQADGAESCVNDRGGDCLSLWSAGEIAELNEDYEIARYLPEFLAIGSNGGDEAVGLDRVADEDPDDWPVVQIGFGNLDREDFVRLAEGFRDWWARGFPLRRAGPADS